MIKRKLPPPSYKGEKDFGSYRATYQEAKLLRAFICMTSGIKNPESECLNGPHGGQSCHEIRQIVREAADHPELQRMRQFGLGYCLPWEILRETSNLAVLVDYQGLPIARLQDGHPPRIVHPNERNYWTWEGSFFPIDAYPQDKDVFAAGFLLASGYGLMNEVVWRSFLSDFGTKHISKWSANWWTYGRGTFYNFMHGT